MEVPSSVLEALCQTTPKLVSCNLDYAGTNPLSYMADLVAEVQQGTFKVDYVFVGPEIGEKLKNSLHDCHEMLWGIPVFHLKCETRFLAACVAVPPGIGLDPYLHMAWLVDPVMKADLVTRIPPWSPYKETPKKLVYKWDQDSLQNVAVEYEPIGNTGIWKQTYESLKNLDFGPLEAKLAAQSAQEAQDSVDAQKAELVKATYAPVMKTWLQKGKPKSVDEPDMVYDLSALNKQPLPEVVWEETAAAPSPFTKTVPYHAVVESDGTVKFGNDLTIPAPTPALTATTASFTNTGASNITITGTSNWDGTYVVGGTVQDGILLQGTPVKKSR